MNVYNNAQEESIVDSPTHFVQDVLNGLSVKPKRLSPKYFYDTVGNKLFQKIMNLEEYYLTRTELEILNTCKEEILNTFDQPFRLIELGAGDGKKTKVLLKHFVSRKVSFTYSPVDISMDILKQLGSSLLNEIPGLKVELLSGDYFHIMGETMKHKEQRNVVLFLGSNIGNYNNIDRDYFLQKLRDNLKKGDQVLIGFDLRKNPQKILSAYNDSNGVTRNFNKNLLTRINNELGGNFNTDRFLHFPSYNPDTGECRSYLLSTEKQTVHIASLEKDFHFNKWESIFMEISKKFNIEEIEELAQRHDFIIRRHFTDSKEWFLDSVWEAV